MKGRTKKCMALLTALTLALSVMTCARPQSTQAASKTAVKTMQLRIGKENVTKKTHEMTAGTTAKLSVSTSPAAAAKAGLTFRSSDKSVAAVNKEGRISARKAGAANISVTVSGKKYQAKSTWVTIYVTPQTAPATKATAPAVVALDKGSIMGYNENGIYTFKGVPYGSFDRFKYAVPTASYGTSDRPSFAMSNGSVSPQSNTRTAYSNWAASAAFMTPSESDMFSTESECLNLNIWTDSLDETAKKPVLVFMHGGGLENGSALELKIYDGKYFADYTDVVFVSVNARLNYVGYLDLTAIGGDANIGVSDMTLSLKWVRDNIAKFGGDPANVTIMGQSGCGTKVTALASAPAADGLFQKVMYASGGAASGRTPQEAAQNAHTLADYVRSNVPQIGDEAAADKLSDEMASALAAFCATGNPSTSSLKWDPYTVSAPRTMIFDRENVCKDSTFDDALESIMTAE